MDLQISFLHDGYKSVDSDNEAALSTFLAPDPDDEPSSVGQVTSGSS
jgi:hypothetical protein